MHASELLLVAAAVADNCHIFIPAPLARSSAGLQQYWIASRERLDRWTRSLALCGEPGKAAKPAGGDSQGAARPVIEEILLAEVLTRVWAAVATAHDEHHRGQILAPVAHSVFLGHQEARKHALLAILHARGLSPREVRRLNVLRQKCERWTDLLLAYFPTREQNEHLAFCRERVEEFAEDLAHEAAQGAKQAAGRLTMASLEAAARRGVSNVSPSAALNQKIAAGVLGCLPIDALDSTGLFSLLWQTRIEHTANDTLSMVSELLALD